jgi:hypothetical protein
MQNVVHLYAGQQILQIRVILRRWHILTSSEEDAYVILTACGSV